MCKSHVTCPENRDNSKYFEKFSTRIFGKYPPENLRKKWRKFMKTCILAVLMKISQKVLYNLYNSKASLSLLFICRRRRW